MLRGGKSENSDSQKNERKRHSVDESSKRVKISDDRDTRSHAFKLIRYAACIALKDESQRQLRYIEWKEVKIYDFQKVTMSTLFKLYNAGPGVLLPKRYHMWG